MKRTHTHTRMRAVPGLVIRPVRRQIRRLISGLMNDLANYQRYFKKKKKKRKKNALICHSEVQHGVLGAVNEGD